MPETIFVSSIILVVFVFHTLLNNRLHLGGREKQDGMLELQKYWTSVRNKNVITVPFRLSFFLGYKNIENRYITLFSNIGKGQIGEEYRWLIKDRYPFVRNELDEVVKKYELDCIVVDKSAAISMNIVSGNAYYDFSKYPCLFENDFYAVYSTNS